MQDADIFTKTDAGRDEIKSRARGLSMAARAILLMVDGQRDVAALRTVIAGSKAPADTLATLLAQGLIAAPSGSTASPSAPSISTPRSATMGRPVSAVPPFEAGSAGSAGAEPPARGVAYAEPLDLTLATIVAPTRSPGPASPDVAAAGSSTAAGRYEHLYTMMNEIVRDFLPAHRRYFIQLKIERCGTADELLELLATVQAALAKVRGDAFANEVVSRVRSATG